MPEEAAYDEELQASLPRSATMEGDDLAIAAVRPDGLVIVTDGERWAPYTSLQGEPLEGSDLKIVPRYVEAGAFTEANCVSLTDGRRTAVYVPVRSA